MLLFLPKVQKIYVLFAYFFVWKILRSWMFNFLITIAGMIIKKILYSPIQQGSGGFDTCSLIRSQWVSCTRGHYCVRSSGMVTLTYKCKTEDNVYNLDNIRLLLVVHILAGCPRPWVKASNFFSCPWSFSQFLSLVWYSDFLGPKLVFMIILICIVIVLCQFVLPYLIVFLNFS